ncbi:MAG: PRC-barrel domain-containing protein [Pseudomonadota bacterium]
MKRIFASALALTLAAPVLADTNDVKADDTANMTAPIQMDDSWTSDDMARFDAPMIEREGWVTAGTETMTAEELTGLRLYSSNDEWIGEIDNVIVDTTGQIQGAVLGVGGFVGIGEKDVLVTFDSLTIKSETDGDDMRAYTDMTEEQLEELPAYES